tara:strand:- start:571 stop:675 length:105 start_codon:yes stop_codon:yes gene_type:complete
MGTLKRDKYKPKKTNEIKLKKFIQKIKLEGNGNN